MTDRALLALENEMVFEGVAIGAPGEAVGEVVFNTAMTGYQEILTDPSYAKQIVTFTYPHIGNTGINQEDEESTAIWAQGLVIRDKPLLASNWRNQISLSDYLKQRNVVAIAGVDTRKLTRVLREEGAQNGCILSWESVTGERVLQGRVLQGRILMNIRLPVPFLWRNHFRVSKAWTWRVKLPSTSPIDGVRVPGNWVRVTGSWPTPGFMWWPMTLVQRETFCGCWLTGDVN